MSTHEGETDTTHQVTLPSSIEQVQWTDLQAAPGGAVGLEISTRYVGNAATLQIKLTDHRGTTHETFQGQIHNNHLTTRIRVPPKAEKALYAEVKFPKHGLNQKSPALLLMPPVKVKNPRWSESEARRGDTLTCTAEVEEAPNGTEATVTILEHDRDGGHDLVSRIPTSVKDGKVEVKWDFEYHDDVEDIPTEEEAEKGYHPPEYFFRVDVSGVEAESDLLTFKDWVEFELKTYTGSEEYILHLPDGSQRKGAFDSDGSMREEDIPPGPISIEIVQT